MLAGIDEANSRNVDGDELANCEVYEVQRQGADLTRELALWYSAIYEALKCSSKRAEDDCHERHYSATSNSAYCADYHDQDVVLRSISIKAKVCDFDGRYLQLSPDNSCFVCRQMFQWVVFLYLCF